MAVEIDERTLTPQAANTPPRYHGDPTHYAPDMKTPSGFFIGRSLPGTNVTPTTHGGALQLFVAHNEALEACEDVIRGYCDHAQVHPGILHLHGDALAGRGYWVRAELPSLLSLAAKVDATNMVAMPPVLMVPAPGAVTTQSHGRVVVPFKDGVIGESILSAVELAWLRHVLSDGGTRPILEHLDFNGSHYGTSDDDAKIKAALDIVRSKYETTVFANVGMTHFQSNKINIEQYPVQIL